MRWSRSFHCTAMAAGCCVGLLLVSLPAADARPLQPGAVLATIPIDAHAVAIGVDPAAHHVFVASTAKTDKVGHPAGKGRLAMLDAASGRLLHTTAIPEGPLAMAVDTRHGRVFVAGVGAVDQYGQSKKKGSLSTVDTRSGAVLRTIAVGGGDTNSWPSAWIAVDMQTARVFVANLADNSVAMLDAMTGMPLKTTAVGARPKNIAVDERSGRVFVLNDGDNTISVLDAATGGVLRTINAGAHAFALAVDGATGHLFVAHNRYSAASAIIPGSVTLFDGASGKALRTATVGKEPYAMAIDSGRGHLFVVNAATGGRSTVSMLSTRDGGVLYTATVDTDSIAMVLDARNGRVFVASELSGVSILDAATGAMRGHVALDVTGIVGVDDVTGRVFVTGNSFPCTVSVLDANAS